jgi:hypothetical protein
MQDPFKKADGAAPVSTADPLREALLAHSRRLGVLSVSSGVGAGAIDAFLYQGAQLGAEARRALTLALTDGSLDRRPNAQERPRQGRSPRG